MFKIGASTVVINGEVGADIQGAGVKKKAERVRDNLEANALLMESNGSKILFINCDLAGVEASFIKEIRKKISKKIDIGERDVLISCSHTHTGPSIIKTCYTKPIDEEYLERLKGWLIEAAVKAEEALRTVKIGSNMGHAQIGYNRRACFEDGRHVFGKASTEGFTGLEGEDDDRQYVLCAVDEDDKPLAILHSNTAHPTNFYGCDFFSADYPGEARKLLREAFGDIPVLYLNGCCGDIGPLLTSTDNRSLNNENVMRHQGWILAGETMRQIYDMDFKNEAEINHTFEDMVIPVRMPEEKDLKEAREMLAAVDKGENIPLPAQIMAFGAVDLYDRFKDNPEDTLAIHVVRIGELVIATNPCELFCHYGKQIKRRSNYEKTVVCELTDGFSGYCPTMEGILGGGYSGKAISWTRLSHDAGYRIVDSVSKLIRKI